MIIKSTATSHNKQLKSRPRLKKKLPVGCREFVARPRIIIPKIYIAKITGKQKEGNMLASQHSIASASHPIASLFCSPQRPPAGRDKRSFRRMILRARYDYIALENFSFSFLCPDAPYKGTKQKRGGNITTIYPARETEMHRARQPPTSPVPYG